MKQISLKDMRRKAAQVFDRLDVSDTTREDYRQHIELFFRYLRQNRLHQDSFLKYKRWLGKQAFGVSARNKYLTVARVLLKELNRTGVIDRDITQNIRCFKQSGRHIKTGFSLREVSLMAGIMCRISLRSRALFCLYAYQGLRTIEIERMRVLDINIPGRSAFITGKGRDTRERIELHDITADALEKYITRRFMERNDTPSFTLFSETPLFPSIKNKGKGLCRRQLQNIIKGIAAAVGIKGTAHGLRHFFITYLIDHVYGGDLMQVIKYSRHKDIKMLQVYYDEHRDSKKSDKFHAAFAEILPPERGRATGKAAPVA
jgi:integrase